jgi:hypothetical protein
MPHASPRPAGDPAVLGVGARVVAAAADAVETAGAAARGAVSGVVRAGAWRGPASEAFGVDGGHRDRDLAAAADALRGLAGDLAELAGRLGQAQATWERAAREAEGAGLALLPDGTIAGAGPAMDMAQVATAAQVIRLTAAAADQAEAARRAVHLDGAAGPAAAHPPAGSHGRGGPRRWLGAGLDAGGQLVAGLDHAGQGAEARTRTAGRVLRDSPDPAARLAAARAVQAAERPLLDARLAAGLPLVGPALDLVAGLAEGEPLPRAAARALGGAIGGDVGARAGAALCAATVAATEGAGLVVCPAVSAAGGAVGVGVGRALGTRLYDAAGEWAGGDRRRPAGGEPR